MHQQYDDVHSAIELLTRSGYVVIEQSRIRAYFGEHRVPDWALRQFKGDASFTDAVSLSAKRECAYAAAMDVAVVVGPTPSTDEQFRANPYGVKVFRALMRVIMP